jgi:MFS family permease
MAQKESVLPWRRSRTAAAGETAEVREKLWTRSFALVCLAACFAYSSTAILGPIIPLRVVDLGGSSATAGIVVAIFGGIGFILRPLAGRLIDVWRAGGVFACGSILVGLGSLSWLIPSFATPYLAQVLTGFGWSGVGPGGQSMVGILTPATRRGEAAGYYQVALTAGSAALPAVGLWLVDVSGFAIVFAIAGILAFLGAASLLGVREAPKPAVASRPSQSFVSALFEREAMLPSSFILLAVATGPATTAFLPLLAKERGIGDVAGIFLVSGIVAIIAQLTIGRSSDRIGSAGTLRFCSALLYRQPVSLCSCWPIASWR